MGSSFKRALAKSSSTGITPKGVLNPPSRQTATPQKIWGQVIYVVLAIGFGFAPYTIYQIVTTKALDYFKKKADDIEEKK